MEDMEPPRGLPAEEKLSEALRRENMVSASGKLGGVAGVFAGVHIYKREKKRKIQEFVIVKNTELPR